jgi:hypothetical protein
MKILKNKTYKELIDKITNLELRCYEYSAKLEKAENLKDILDKMTSMTINGIGFANAMGSWNLNMDLPDNVAQYVEDMLGGKVIKQEANKVIKIDQQGNVTTGLTKQAKDKGFSYKLIRE